MVLRLGYVAGVSPGRWVRTWADRRPDQPLEATRVDESVQLDGLVAGEHDLAFVRLPVEVDGDLHAIPLWEEVPVVVLPATTRSPTPSRSTSPTSTASRSRPCRPMPR
ncbi:hypothetical protein ET445_06855 [Agromyces protaetiae]|uniref:LysR substrate-binding domain-containing protein n=1 Tax=Agromyces protaetiae TaxID=2509455 RepID=A0A4P6FFD3_9MICO|nr:LysR substrate-binding domain-containing protein [Agromyces protaetiae]QAY73109.1 hypothetical protein ET445_06855 [Agromyces protaetiae]